MSSLTDQVGITRQLAELNRFIQTACAFTGPRPERLPWRTNETDPACIALKEVLAEEIKALSDEGIVNFLSGMAQGVDQYCAAAVLALRENNSKIRLHCILPCISQTDKWAARARVQYRAILDQADSIVYVSREEHSESMMARNHFLVNYSAVLLAVYHDNGIRRSGTAATVRYARKQGRRLIAIDPDTLQITREGSAHRQN